MIKEDTDISLQKPMRIAKWLARAGIASRRDAEKLIAEKKIKCNGFLVTHPATGVMPKDTITYNGHVVKLMTHIRLWRYYKPRGLLVTNHDPQNRATIYDALPKALGRVISVGRLDLDSEGLLLLTNNGALARKLEHPKSALTRQYRVRVYGTLNMNKLRSLKDGCKIGNVRYGPIHVLIEGKGKYATQNAKNTWLLVTLREGKNREIRKVMAHCGLQVNRLIRTHYGPFCIDDLKIGETQEIQSKMFKGMMS